MGSEFDLDQIAQAGRPFEKIVEDSLKNQTRNIETRMDRKSLVFRRGKR